MIHETKIGEAIVVKQTTYYVYQNEEDRKNDKWFISTSDTKKINDIKRQIRTAFKRNSK